MRTRLILALCVLAFLFLPAIAGAAKPFRFEEYPSLNKMREFIIKELPLGAAREKARQIFVKEGKATIVTQPARKQTEKYIYDLDLCGAYIWRWNISADYDDDGKLQQAYVNGNPVHMSGKEDPLIARREFGKWRKMLSKKVSRKESTKENAEENTGEDAGEMTYFLKDTDGDLSTTDDQAVMGAGFATANPFSMMETYFYKDVFPWRSIFDADKSTGIVPYPNCKTPTPGLPEFLRLFLPDITGVSKDN